VRAWVLAILAGLASGVVKRAQLFLIQWMLPAEIIAVISISLIAEVTRVFFMAPVLRREIPTKR